MRGRSCFIVFISIVCFLCAASLPAAEGDHCSGQGIVVKNMTMLDLWYKKDNGDCTIWRKNHILRMSPAETFEIFSDLACNKLYCSENPTYEKYKSLDADGDCRVRILSLCNLSDM
jgi:hypothetical protein